MEGADSLPGDVGPGRLCGKRLEPGTYAAPNFAIWSFCFHCLPTNCIALAQQVGLACLSGEEVVGRCPGGLGSLGERYLNLTLIVLFWWFYHKRWPISPGNQVLLCQQICARPSSISAMVRFLWWWVPAGNAKMPVNPSKLSQLPQQCPASIIQCPKMSSTPTFVSRHPVSRISLSIIITVEVSLK